MKIVSFARTTAALKARQKTVTRREWKDSHASRFSPGELVAAWSAAPYRGGKPVGIIRVKSVTREPTCLIPDEDWKAEGFDYMTRRGINVGPELSCSQLWEQWRKDKTKQTYVLRFEVVKIFRGARSMKAVAR